MIDRERFDNLSVEALQAVATCEEALDCAGVQCDECPFELEHIIGESFVCALVYTKKLYRRLTK